MVAEERSYLETNIPVFVAFRIKAGYSGRALAKELGVSESTISRIESGQRNASPKLGRKIAKKFGVPMEVLFFIHVPHSNETVKA